MKNPFFGEKWWNYFLPVFKATQKLGVTFFGLFLFFLFLLHLVEGCAKKTYFYRFFAHLAKASSAIMQQQGSKAKTPKKIGAHFFSETPFLTKFFSKTLILHHPLITVHQKISKKTYFYRLKKDGQVINSTMAKLLTLKWPKNGQVINPTAYIYIYNVILGFFSQINLHLSA